MDVAKSTILNVLLIIIYLFVFTIMDIGEIKVTEEVRPNYNDMILPEIIDNTKTTPNSTEYSTL
jgi:hypothetical protein